MANKILQGTSIKMGIQFYKYLLRECEKLPTKDVQQFYKFSFKQSFKKYSSESKPEKIQEIIEKGPFNGEWVAQKVLRRQRSASGFVGG